MPGTLEDFQDENSKDKFIEFDDKSRVKILQRRINQCNSKALTHRKHSNLYNFLHYLIGFPQIMLTLALTYITQNRDCRSASSDALALSLGAIASGLGLALTFFNMKEEAQRHRNSALLYEDLSSDTLTSIHNKSDLSLIELMFNEKMKLINIEEPNRCVSYCCFKNDT